MSKHPNVELLERAFAAFGRDPVAVGRAIADDAVWRVPGANAMAGEYRGREAIFGFLRRTGELTGDTYRTRLQYVVADDERAVAVYRATGERGGRTLVPLRDPAEEWLRDAIGALVEHVRRGGAKRLAVERFDGRPVTETEVMPILLEAGFLAGPRRAVLRP